ncbi:MAG: hypothetical protein ACREMB_16910 [Candidatus Rokuibacteriota bacterium]
MGVIVGRIRKLDPTGRSMLLGGTEVWIGDGIAFEELAPGMSVTVSCEERQGRYWATAIKRNLA